MTESNDWFLEDKALDVGTPKDIDENKLNELIKFMRENRVRPSKFF